MLADDHVEATMRVTSRAHVSLAVAGLVFLAIGTMGSRTRCVPVEPEPPACEGENPQGCVSTGCPDGEACVQLSGVCVPSACSCDESTGAWICTADCSGGACVAPPAERCEVPDPDAILAAAYGGPRFPDGFYTEELGGYSLYYENTVSILPADERTPEWRELCTDDPEQAAAWSEAGSVNSSQYRPLIEARETEKHFEFVRDGRLLSRVHKCAYVDRSMYDRFHPGEVLARYNVRPVTAQGAAELVEYLWFTRYYNNASAKTLCAATSTETGAVLHTLHTLRIVYGDWDMCDQITLVANVYRVDTTTGDVTVTRSDLTTVEGICR